MVLDKQNTDRENTETIYTQQVVYQQALAGCSRSLLVPADNESDQQKVLNQALEHLRSGADASRVYTFRVFDDPELGLCAGILAEVCTPGTPPGINNPVNKKFPLTHLPTEMVNVLAEGKPYGGPVKQAFATTPQMLDEFLSQKPPILSFMLFPIFDRDQWWGFVGFDDCISERIWDERETSILGTASEMIGITLQRWQTATQLQETLDHLEQRVEERTADLNKEVQERRQAQDDLAGRLQIEEKLAAISSRLLEPSNIRENITISLEDLMQIMNAVRVFLVEFDLQAPNQAKDYIECHRQDILPVSRDVIHQVMESLDGFGARLRLGETIFIEDTTRPPADGDINLAILNAHNVKSMVLSPLVIDRRIYGVLGCSNPQAPSDNELLNLRPLELVASMLKSLMQREHLIETLEEQVAERTRQLTTFLDMAMLTDQSQDLADILQPTLRSISQIVDYDALGIHLVDEKIPSLTLIAQMGIPSDFLELLDEIELDAELAAWLDEPDSSQTLYQPDHDPIFPEPFCLPDYQAYYSIRLRTGNKTLGIMNCYRMADQPFTPFQTMLLTSLGDLLGIIIENHHFRLEGQELATIEERQRLAREVHDAVSQAVYSLSLFARSANNALEEGDTEELSANLEDIEKTALRAMREMRLLLYQLQEIRQDQNLEATLDNRFRNVENRLGIKSTREIETDIILPTYTQREVWLIINEALNNAVKHASYTCVHVGVSCSDENLMVSIQDDGVGFDTRDYSPGMGLENMRARAETLDGSLEITSKLGQGTQILLMIPMSCLDPGEGEKH